VNESTAATIVNVHGYSFVSTSGGRSGKMETGDLERSSTEAESQSTKWSIISQQVWTRRLASHYDYEISAYSFVRCKWPISRAVGSRSVLINQCACIRYSSLRASSWGGNVMSTTVRSWVKNGHRYSQLRLLALAACLTARATSSRLASDEAGTITSKQKLHSL